MISSRLRRASALLVSTLGLALALALLPSLAAAATFTVNTTADVAPAADACLGTPGDCALRQAVAKADGNGEDDTIVLPAGDYGLTLGAEGDLVVEDGLTIEGAGARRSVIDASGINDRVFDVVAQADLTLKGLKVTGGNTSEDGGGIRVEGSNAGVAALTLDGVAVEGNESFDHGEGGGIYAEEAEVTIVDSSVSRNRNSGDGGGYCAFTTETLIEDSTFADNEVDTSLYPAEPKWRALGGAIEAYDGSFALRNVTITGNSIADKNGEERGEGAALRIGEFSSVQIVNTIVADNTAFQTNQTGQCRVTTPTLGHNLETAEPAGEPRCFEGPTDLVADPLLGPLADNGGETDTAALAVGSPAIDAGDVERCPPTDQRGVARVGACDIGAFEYVAPPTPPTPSTTPAAPASTTTAPASTPAAKYRFGIKKIIHVRRTGSAKLRILFNGPGLIQLSGKGLKPVSVRVTVGTSYVPVTPGSALAALLAKKGRVHVIASVQFTPDAGVGRIKDKKVGVFLLS